MKVFEMLNLQIIPSLKQILPLFTLIVCNYGKLIMIATRDLPLLLFKHSFML